MRWPFARSSVTSTCPIATVDLGSTDTGLVDVTGLGDLQDNRLLVALPRASVLIVRFGRSVVALDNKCPHLGKPLSGGTLSGGRTRCDAHGYEWDLESGRSAPCAAGQVRRTLGTMPVRVVDDRVLVTLPAQPPLPGEHGDPTVPADQNVARLAHDAG